MEVMAAEMVDDWTSFWSYWNFHPNGGQVKWSNMKSSVWTVVKSVLTCHNSINECDICFKDFQACFCEV